MGCDAQGKGLRQIVSGEANRTLSSVGMSGDGNVVGFHFTDPDEIGVIGFDGKNRRALLKDDPRFAFGRSEPIYLTFDGSQLLRTGRLSVAAGGRSRDRPPARIRAEAAPTHRDRWAAASCVQDVLPEPVYTPSPLAP